MNKKGNMRFRQILVSSIVLLTVISIVGVASVYAGPARSSIQPGKYRHNDGASIQIYVDGHRGIYSELGSLPGGNTFIGGQIDPIGFNQNGVESINILVNQPEEGGFLGFGTNDVINGNCEFIIQQRTPSGSLSEVSRYSFWNPGEGEVIPGTYALTTPAAFLPAPSGSIPIQDPAKSEVTNRVNSLTENTNYWVSVECPISDGSRIKDAVYAYVVPSSVSPPPYQGSFQVQGNSFRHWLPVIDASVAIKLVANGNDYGMGFLGVASSINKHPYTLNPGSMHLEARVDQASGPQKLAGAPTMLSCNLRVSQVTSSGGGLTLLSLIPLTGTFVGQSEASTWSDSSYNTGWMNGNYLFKMECLDDGGRSYEDALYLYAAGGGGSPPQPPSPPPQPSGPPQCSNGIDDPDPEDTIADYPNDPGCSSPQDDNEVDPIVNPLPVGRHDESSCTVGARGWARDANAPNNGSNPIKVHIYVDGPADGTRSPVVELIANEYRGDPGWAYTDRNHGFTWALPNQLKDGQNHSIRVYAIDYPTNQGGSQTLLQNSVININCSPPSTPPPQQPPGSGPRVDLKVQKQ